MCQFGDESGLSDTRLAADQHYIASPLSGSDEYLVEDGELIDAADEPFRADPTRHILHGPMVGVPLIPTHRPR